MDSIVRAVIVYVFLLVIFRVAGKRTLSEMTNFDFILLLIISETTEQALIGSDHSMTNAALLIICLVGVDIGLSVVKLRFPAVEKWLDGCPLVLVQDGRMFRERMDKERVDEGDLLEAARKCQGLESIDQIKYAVLERNGAITIIPRAPQG